MTTKPSWELIMDNYEQLLSEKEKELATLKALLDTTLSKANVDSARLDWLDNNMFHRDMDDFDAKTMPTSSMWVMFSPKGVQGRSRGIIDAAITRDNAK